MLREKSIRICIVEPNLEVAALKVLADSHVICAGRYLDPEEIPRELRPQTLLVTSPLTLRTRSDSAQRMGFLKVVCIDEKSVSSLVEMITDALPSESDESANLAPGDFEQVVGVLPRVGATTLQVIVERELSDEIFAYRIHSKRVARHIICAEIDDLALARLFQIINEDAQPRKGIAVAINKLPRTTAARRKFKAVARELRGIDVALACPIFFDSDIQISGHPSKQMIRELQPLFDWIAKSN